MAGKELVFENGAPRDACDHDDVIVATGANPVCRLCGTALPEYERGEDEEADL